MMRKPFLVFAALGLLAGCTAQRTNFPPPDTGAGAPPPPEQPGQASPTTEPPAPIPPRTAEEVSSPAVLSLMGRAETLARSGHMDMSAATLERALDLEPRNAFVYQRLASVRLAQGNTGQAEAMARKSNSIAGDNPFVRADNWRLIAEARRAAGDRSGAEKATARANDYRNASQPQRQ